MHFGREIIEYSQNSEQESYIGDYAGHNIIFLDVDGVLNCYSTKERIGGYTGIQESLLPVLKQLVDKFHGDLVLSSSWKEGWFHDKNKQDIFANTLDDALSRYGMKIVDKIGTESRGVAILRWLDVHGPVDHYLVLDDEIHDFKGTAVASHWVRTSWGPNGGLKQSHVKYVVRNMERWKYRKE